MGGTASIIRADKTRRYVILAISALLSIAVLILAWPRLRANIRYLPVDHAIQRYYQSGEIPSERIPVLIQFAEEAAEYSDHHRFHDGLSLLYLMRALDLSTPAMERRGDYEAAAAEAMESLRRAPAQPTTWLRLANIRWTLHEEPEDIIEAWKMSIFTGRIASNLFSQRLQLGLSFRLYMDEESLLLLRDQLLLAWRMQPGKLVRILSERDRNLSVTRPLIERTDPTALVEMEAWLAKLH